MFFHAHFIIFVQFLPYLYHGNRRRELITSHENGMKELQEAHTSERSALEKRDSKNVQEIDTLHKKCRCLTKL